jgi:hypothetical protein
MAYEYECVTVPDEKINSALTTRAEAGWELHTATSIVWGQIREQRVFTYLFFRREQ